MDSASRVASHQRLRLSKAAEYLRVSPRSLSSKPWPAPEAIKPAPLILERSRSPKALEVEKAQLTEFRNTRQAGKLSQAEFFDKIDALYQWRDGPPSDPADRPEAPIPEPALAHAVNTLVESANYTGGQDNVIDIIGRVAMVEDDATEVMRFTHTVLRALQTRSRSGLALPTAAETERVLRREWGSHYEHRMALAEKAIDLLYPDPAEAERARDYLDAEGEGLLGDDPQLIREAARFVERYQARKR